MTDSSPDRMEADDRARLWDRERPRLTALAYRIVGGWHEAEDVVARSWPRFEAAGALERPEAWLTTIVTRLAIDAGRRAKARREDYVGSWLPEPVATDRLPEEAAEARSLLGLGMLRVMEALAPEDRAIYVLREGFDVPYADIAACVERSEAACRQVMSRARGSLRAAAARDEGLERGEGALDEDATLRALVDAVAAGDLGEVVGLISEDCVLWADGGGVVKAALHPVRGRDRVAAFLASVGRIPSTASWLEVNGGPAVLYTTAHGRYLYLLEHDGVRVTAIQVHANPAKLEAMGEPRPMPPRG